MPPQATPRFLTSGEYVKTGRSLDDQTANARRLLVQVIQRVVPALVVEPRSRLFLSHPQRGPREPQTASLSGKMFKAPLPASSR